MKNQNIFMKKILLKICFILFISTTITAQNKEIYSIEVYNFEQLETLLQQKNNTTYVVNFWATWCAPCVKELPYFLALDEEHADKNIEVILVSLDFPAKLDSKLKPFVVKNRVKSPVILLDAPNENEWIPKVDKSWSGALPATVIYNKNKRSFYEQSFTQEELYKEVNKFVKIL
jgi:thiol-disulfide isomerase/thioredoxin